MMKAQHLLAVLFLCLCTSIAFAQTDQSFKTITVTADKDTTFDKIIDYLQAKEIFIESVDKQGGFIQGKVFIKDTKILSAKAGENRTMNFILRPSAISNETRITLTIYKEEHYIGDASASIHYYKGLGIMDDATVYRDILDDLQQTIGQ